MCISRKGGACEHRTGGHTTQGGRHTSKVNDFTRKSRRRTAKLSGLEHSAVVIAIQNEFKQLSNELWSVAGQLVMHEYQVVTESLTQYDDDSVFSLEGPFPE